MEFDNELIYPKAHEELEQAIKSSIKEPYREIFLKDVQEHLKNTGRYIEDCIRAHDEHLKWEGSVIPKYNLSYWMVNISGKEVEGLAYSWVHAGIFMEQVPSKYFNQAIKNGEVPRPEKPNKEEKNKMGGIVWLKQ